MARPVTLFTGQWADLPLAELAPKARAFGYDGVELAAAEITVIDDLEGKRYKLHYEYEADAWELYCLTDDEGDAATDDTMPFIAHSRPAKALLEDVKNMVAEARAAHGSGAVPRPPNRFCSPCSAM